MVEGNGLENRRSREATVGSNPTLSAKCFKGFRGFGKRRKAVIFSTERALLSVCT